MNFLDTSFLRTHSQQILAFYDDRVIDSAGGYFQNFYDEKITCNIYITNNILLFF